MDIVIHLIYQFIILVLAILFILSQIITHYERREKERWHSKYVDQCTVRLDEVKQDQARQDAQAARFEIELAELKAKCKAAEISADGWRKAAGKGCAQ